MKYYIAKSMTTIIFSILYAFITKVLGFEVMIITVLAQLITNQIIDKEE